jgi:hypothetical protein
VNVLPPLDPLLSGAISLTVYPRGNRRKSHRKCAAKATRPSVTKEVQEKKTPLPFPDTSRIHAIAKNSTARTIIALTPLGDRRTILCPSDHMPDDSERFHHWLEAVDSDMAYEGTQACAFPSR